MTTQITFKLTSPLRTALALNDDLGFNNAHLACEAILKHEDWQERWDITEQSDIIENWRNSTLESQSMPNKIKGLVLLFAFIGILSSCSPKFYDGEGNKIPRKAVHLLVLKQFVKIDSTEQQYLGRFFYIK